LVWLSANALGVCKREEMLLNAARKQNQMEEELVKLEEEFAGAIVKNSPEKIRQFVTDDWIIINADGGIIDKDRFFEVINSGTLTHEMMESDDMRVRVYGDSAVVSALTRSKRKIHGAGIHYARAVHRRFCEARRTMAVRPDTAHRI
jgi:hypothetical protein